jgi:hypothetical protein
MSYPKFKNKEECAFPEREDCNFDYSKSLKRCPYMKYNNSKSILYPTRWECTYKKEAQNKDNVLKEEESKEIKEGVK